MRYIARVIHALVVGFDLSNPVYGKLVQSGLYLSMMKKLSVLAIPFIPWWFDGLPKIFEIFLDRSWRTLYRWIRYNGDVSFYLLRIECKGLIFNNAGRMMRDARVIYHFQEEIKSEGTRRGCLFMCNS